MRLSLVVLLAGCGRLHFDELRATSDAPEDSVDSALALPCGGPQTAPSEITISGETFEYTSFDNQLTAIPAVNATALDATTAMLIVTTVSAADGGYLVTVPAGGAPRALAMQYATAGYFTTTAFMDLPVVENWAGQEQPVWRFGDAPIWSDAAMTATYAASGETRQVTAGTLNIAVRDCSGSPVDGVSVTITPTPGKLLYQAADGRPSTTLAATVLPFAHAFAVNAQPGMTRIVATKAGRTFVDTEVVVRADRHNTLSIVRAVD